MAVRINAQFAKRPRFYLREWRKHRGLTREQLAELIDQDAPSISQLESGEQSFTDSTLIAIANALRCEPADLLRFNPLLDSALDVDARPRHFVREWRKYRQLSQEHLAELVDKTQGAISQLERGATDYTQGMLEALACAMGCEPADLLRVNPLVDGDVVEVEALLRAAPEEARLQAYAVVRTLLRTRRSAGSASVRAGAFDGETERGYVGETK